jgi:competence protein ComEC
MKWLIASLITLLIIQPFSLEKWVMPWVIPLHNLCLHLAPNSNYQHWYQAIVCGQNLPASVEKSWFQQTGLIHVIVVSGSHLVFLDETLQLLRVPRILRIFLAILFSLVNQLQPPITRALFQRFWNWFFWRQSRPLPAIHAQFLALITSLALFPNWWTSLSFIMSAVCSLGLTLPVRSKRPITQATLVYILMALPIFSLQTPHPASILFNVLFAPILGTLLFPMSLVDFLHASLAALSDRAWQGLFFIFENIPLPDSHEGTVFSVGWLILYLVITQAAAFYFVIRERRKWWKQFSLPS